jgi:hypothetical protein
MSLLHTRAHQQLRAGGWRTQSVTTLAHGTCAGTTIMIGLEVRYTVLSTPVNTVASHGHLEVVRSTRSMLLSTVSAPRVPVQPIQALSWLWKPAMQHLHAMGFTMGAAITGALGICVKLHRCGKRAPAVVVHTKNLPQVSHTRSTWLRPAPECPTLFGIQATQQLWLSATRCLPAMG